MHALVLGALLLACGESAPKDLTVAVTTGERAQPVKNAKVKLFSDNGVRCVRAPCPTNGREWQGATDAKGVVVIPGSMVDRAMSLTVDGFQAVNLPPERPGNRLTVVVVTR